MEMSSREKPSPPLTPQQSNAHNNSNNNNNNNNGVAMTRSEPHSPYPTTFVTADTSSFKQVVQMLTGSSEAPKTPLSGKPPTTPPTPRSFVIPPIKTAPSKKQHQHHQQQGFKLYERRMKNNLLTISPLTTAAASHFPLHHQEILSPSVLDLPSLTLSPVTPLSDDQFDKSSEEERAIADKGFYLHPSPLSTPRDADPPQLLPLFPLSSPRLSDHPSSSSSHS